MNSSALPQVKTAPLSSVSPARKPMVSAAASRQGHLNGAVESHLTGSVAGSDQKRRRTLGKPVENRLHWIGIRLHEKDREVILQQLFRCLGKYDPRAIPRIISKRTGITEQAVDFVFQQTCREFQEWSREVRAGLARADAAAAACWKARTA